MPVKIIYIDKCLLTVEREREIKITTVCGAFIKHVDNTSILTDFTIYGSTKPRQSLMLPIFTSSVYNLRRKSLFFLIIVNNGDSSSNTIHGPFDYFYTLQQYSIYIKSARPGGHSHGSHVNKFYFPRCHHTYTRCTNTRAREKSSRRRYGDGSSGLGCHVLTVVDKKMCTYVKSRMCVCVCSLFCNKGSIAICMCV